MVSIIGAKPDLLLSRNTTTGGLTKLKPEVNIFRILCGKPILKFTKQLNSYLKFLKFIGTYSVLPHVYLHCLHGTGGCASVLPLPGWQMNVNVNVYLRMRYTCATMEVSSVRGTPSSS